MPHKAAPARTSPRRTTCPIRPRGGAGGRAAAHAQFGAGGADGGGGSSPFPVRGAGAGPGAGPGSARLSSRGSRTATTPVSASARGGARPAPGDALPSAPARCVTAQGTVLQPLPPFFLSAFPGRRSAARGLCPRGRCGAGCPGGAGRALSRPRR